MRRLLTLSFALVSLIAAPATAQQAGGLISSDPMPGAPPGVQAWRVQYWTTNAKNEPLRVTGIVAAPMEAIPPRPRRVIAWTHGAWGVAEKCAPSLSSNFFGASGASSPRCARAMSSSRPTISGSAARRCIRS